MGRSRRRNLEGNVVNFRRHRPWPRRTIFQSRAGWSHCPREESLFVKGGKFLGLVFEETLAIAGSGLSEIPWSSGTRAGTGTAIFVQQISDQNICVCVPVAHRLRVCACREGTCDSFSCVGSVPGARKFLTLACLLVIDRRW